MMAKKTAGMPRCRACGYPMIMDETIIEGGAGRKIRRTFLHCVNEECGHIDRVAEYPVDLPGATAAGR